MITIKVGPKGRVATIPDGWRLVADGETMHGDKYANTVTGKFCDLTDEDRLMDCSDFDALIRKQIW